MDWLTGWLTHSGHVTTKWSHLYHASGKVRQPKTDFLSVKLHLRDRRTHERRPPRLPPSRRVDFAATRRPCQNTNGQTDERTDAGNRIWCILALECVSWRQ